jgi:hypothetical protein
MKKSYVYLVAILFVFASTPYCKKKPSNDPCTSESNIALTTTPANGSIEPPAPGPNFPLRVTINSTIPPQGVSIEVKARPEASQTPFFAETRNSTTKDNDFTITGATAGVASIVEITVTSKTCSTNKATASYRFSRK